MNYKHIPVMLEEAIEFLSPKEGQYFIDATLGGAGYTLELARRVGKTGRVLSFDLDPMAIKNAQEVLKEKKIDNVCLANDSFKNITKVAEDHFKKEFSEKGGRNIFSGVVFDLGLSNAQLEDSRRGFSFRNKGPLDMSFSGGEKTSRIINHYPEKDLEKIIREFGEEINAGKIARNIVKKRREQKIENTEELIEVIKESVPVSYRHKKIHFATKTFQAFRMATNEEMETLSESLPEALDLLCKGARMVLVSYHSLEDRIVKNFFKKESKDCLCPKGFPVCNCGHKAKLKIINKKILQASEGELARNPKARSAKMRVAEKL